MADQIEVGNMNAEDVFTTLQEQGLSSSEAAVLVGQWMIDVYGQGKKTFKFTPPVAAVDPACVPSFTRSFAHADWIDGENVVQAETTPGEQGFNARFHQIEEDLDALGADAAKALACTAALRKSVRDALEEIKVALNQIHSDVYACCGGSSSSAIPAIPGQVATSPVAGLGQLSMQTSGQFDFFGQPMMLYSTQKGLVALPSLKKVTAHPQIGARVIGAGKLAAFFASHPAVAARFGTGPVTKTVLVAEFGQEIAADGRTVAQLVSMIPKNASFPSLGALVGALAELEGAALRSSPAERSALKTSLGLVSDDAPAAEASIGGLVFLPHAAKTALANAGTTTVAALAAAPVDRLLRTLREAGVDVSGGQVSEWIATAKTIGAIDA